LETLRYNTLFLHLIENFPNCSLGINLSSPAVLRRLFHGCIDGEQGFLEGHVQELPRSIAERLFPSSVFLYQFLPFFCLVLHGILDRITLFSLNRNSEVLSKQLEICSE